MKRGKGKKKNKILNIKTDENAGHGTSDEIEQTKNDVKGVVLQDNKAETGAPAGPAESTNKPAVKDFILVSFKGSDEDQEQGSSSSAKAVYYVGWIVRFITDHRVETKFLRRTDLKKTEQMKFCYPEEDDFSCHSINDIVLVLEKPIHAIKSIRSSRIGSFISLDDERLSKFSPIK